MKYEKGRGFVSAPVDLLALTRSRANMPRLAKNPNDQPPKRAKAGTKKGRKKTTSAPKKSLPLMRTHGSLSRQAKAQPRNERGQFVPVDQRSFFGKVGAFLTGEMRQHIQANQAAIQKQERAMLRRQAQEKKS